MFTLLLAVQVFLIMCASPVPRAQTLPLPVPIRPLPAPPSRPPTLPRPLPPRPLPTPPPTPPTPMVLALRLLILLCTAFLSFCSLASSSAFACSRFCRLFMHITATAANNAKAGTAVERVAIITTCSVVKLASLEATCLERLPGQWLEDDSAGGAFLISKIVDADGGAAGGPTTAPAFSPQMSPCQPFGHSHRKPLTRFRHVPPFRHGELRHSSTSTLQSLPVKPGLHTQR